MVKILNYVFYFFYLNLLQSFAGLHNSMNEFPIYSYIQSILLEKNSLWQI